ncbi:MAG TPA: DUF4173 domain-containing protein [Chloroflexia bacterium]|nr:DUF4173 domain-containing protein [Chloroflexia bacterium]
MDRDSTPLPVRPAWRSGLAAVRAPAALVGVALILGTLTDYFFYGQPLGISVPLFVLIALAALFGLARREGVRAAHRNLWLLGPLLFFAIMVAVRANGFLTFVNVVMLPLLAGLLAYFFTGGTAMRLGLLGYPVVLARTGWHALTAAAAPVRSTGRALGLHRGRVRLAGPLLRGLTLALPVLALFTCLLASADSIFSDYVEQALRFHFLRDLPEALFRSVLILGAAWLLAGGLVFALTRRPAVSETDRDTAGAWRPHFSVGFVEAVTVLGLVNALFLAFGWVQFAFLFSGEAGRTMGYEVYREYVRRGFGELLVVAVLTLALILGLRWLAWKETAREARTLNVLCSVMVGLALVLLLSAFMRMVIWEQIEYYISTQLRLYIRWFIGWLALTFTWLAYTLWGSGRRFAIGGFVALLGFLISINLMNPDSDVARYNLARHDELSTRYIDLLSDDGVPALVAGFDATSGEEQRVLRDNLTWRLRNMEADPSWQSWPAFHFARSQAYTSLMGLRHEGKIGGPLAPAR